MIIRTYIGNEKVAMALFRKRAKELADEGYYPISQVWAPGTWGCWYFLLALVLCIVVIGLLVFIYMLIVKPDGRLTVTYKLQENSSDKESGHNKTIEEKTCPKCAEQIKKAALVCRFCKHEFIEEVSDDETNKSIETTPLYIICPHCMELNGPKKTKCKRCKRSLVE